MLSPVQAQKARLFGLVLPLLAALTLFFFLPVGNLLLRAVQEPELATLAPEFQREIRAWSGEGVPPDAVLRAFRDDMATLQGERRVAVVAKRAAVIDPAYREMVMAAARLAATDPPPAPETLLASDPLLQDPATWANLRQLFAPLTDSYLLATLDLRRDHATGNIVPVPPNEAIFIDTLVRTLGISLSVTLIRLLLTYPLAGVSLRWYEAVLTSPQWMAALKSSLIVGVATVVIATPLGTLAPFVLVAVTAPLAGFDFTQIRAGASLGAKPLRVFFRVTLPQIAPGVATGAIFAFITSWDEVVVALFVAGPGQRTLPRQMFAGLREQLDPSIMVVATIMIVTSVLLVALGLLLRWRTGRSG